MPVFFNINPIPIYKSLAFINNITNNSFILYHSQMDDKVLLGLSIPTASEKLKGLFPIDARGDVIISFKTKKFKLQKAYLRL